MARVGVDIDDVLMPWAETAHRLCAEAGLTGGLPAADHWEFYRDWPCTEEQVWDLLDAATQSGALYLDVPPYAGAREGLERLLKARHSVHLVTARGFVGGYRDLIREQTVRWLSERDMPHTTLTFATDKRVVGVDWFCDDSVRNYDALAGAGVKARLLTRSHNLPKPGTEDLRRQRVESFSAFCDEVIAAERSYTEQVQHRLSWTREAS